MSTILIRKGFLLDPDLEFERNDILIEGERISRVASQIDFDADKVIDATDKVIIPGLISAHTHAFATPVRGLVDGIPTEPWLLYSQKDALGLLYSQRGSAGLRDLYVWCAIAATELLKTGTTSIVDMGPTLTRPTDFDSQVDTVANAFVDTGIRAMVAPMYWDLSFSEFLPLHLLGDLKPEEAALLNEMPMPKANEIIHALRGFLKRWRGRNSRITVGLGPREADICTRDLMERTVQTASEFDAGLQTHLLAMKSRVIVGNRMFGQPVVEYLKSLNFLTPRTSLAHAIWLDDRDIEVLAESNCSVVHSPISNVKLGEGVAPVQNMREYGLNVALGVDSCGCNDSLNTFEAMKYAATIHMLNEQPSKWVGASDVFAMCLRGGARVLRQKVGSLRPGFLADIVILGTDKLFMMPKEHFINQLVYSELGNSVETVLVGGQVVVENRVVKTVDERELYAEASESIKKIYSDIASLKKRFGPMGHLLERLHLAVVNQELPFSRLIE